MANEPSQGQGPAILPVRRQEAGPTVIEVEEDGARDIAATLGLTVVDINALELVIFLSNIPPFRRNAMLQTNQLPVIVVAIKSSVHKSSGEYSRSLPTHQKRVPNLLPQRPAWMVTISRILSCVEDSASLGFLPC
jgi:hypothetical protein